MSAHDPAVLLDDMLASLAAIQGYMTGVDKAAFQANPMLQDAVIRRLEILGEAANLLSADYRTQHPEIPWRAITGMRNRLIHGYFVVDIDVVWNTIQTDLQPLEPALRNLRQQQP
jgi:uncharacterized protein with HEPN domain